ncbi:MAG: hypothetical protein HRU76_14290 [Phycisphaeraceae bacterium]|nr:hypothetical protein [Phycisphaerales bacterium]QOJ18680.1 MAG: hypothetical protein HRU76_14290 [Phycisphaeraceae bacterium]
MMPPAEEPVGGLSPSLVGLVLGVSAAIPLYLWQGSPQIAIASFVIVGYTGWLWAHSFNHAALASTLSRELRSMSINRHSRRVGRMLLDPGFWWTMLFGGLMVSGSVWYAGVRDPAVVTAVAASWGFIALCMSYGYTLVHPTSNCRRCGYDLRGQLASDPEAGVVRCPECSAKWSRWQVVAQDQAPSIVRTVRRAA